jgi:hypothetical protein
VTGGKFRGQRSAPEKAELLVIDVAEGYIDRAFGCDLARASKPMGNPSVIIEFRKVLMATWRWADLSTAAVPPAPIAAGDPIAYGIPECKDGPFLETGGCPINTGRVTFRAVGNDIYELSLALAHGAQWQGQWRCNNLFSYAVPELGGEGTAPAAIFDPTAHVTLGSVGGDTVDMGVVNYVAEFGNIYQLVLSPGGWNFGKMAPSGARPADGRAFGYYDSDNQVDRMVYRGTPDGNGIYEIFEISSEYVFANLNSDYSGIPAQSAAGNPFGYNHGGVPRVVYRGTDDHIWEGYLSSAGWKWNDLFKASGGGAPLAAGDPYAYVFNVARVIYRDTYGRIVELALEERGWQWSYLPNMGMGALGDPFGYVTLDNIPRVIYRGTDNHIWELSSQQSRNWVWQPGDLSKIANATSLTQVAAGNPCGYYLNPDSIPRVVYRAANGHINELALY